MSGVRRRLALRALVVAAVGAAALVAAAVPASPGAYPGQNGLIAFARDDFSDGLSATIWTVDPVTGEQVQLTDELGVLDEQPEWSPDGKKIAFSRDTGNQGLIAVMDADGSNVTPLTADDGNTCPTWSPDGTRIAYSDGPGDIVIISATDGAVLVTLPVGTCQLSWSPLGDLIAFSRGDGIEVIAPVAGAAPTQLTTNQLDEYPTWSPDGRRIVFERDGSIMTIAADGSDEQVVLAGATEHTMPAYSPDGTRIVVVELTTGGFGGSIVTVAATGGSTTPLTQATETVLDLDPDWQPLIAPPPPPPTPVPVEPTFTG